MVFIERDNKLGLSATKITQRITAQLLTQMMEMGMNPRAQTLTQWGFTEITEKDYTMSCRHWTGEQEHRREPGPQGQVSGMGTQQELDLRIFGARNIFISSEGAGRWQIMP
ncbi:unnamed protein product [Eretmochelys imbricata]